MYEEKKKDLCGYVTCADRLVCTRPPATVGGRQAGRRVAGRRNLTHWIKVLKLLLHCNISKDAGKLRNWITRLLVLSLRWKPYENSQKGKKKTLCRV